MFLGGGGRARYAANMAATGGGGAAAAGAEEVAGESGLEAGLRLVRGASNAVLPDEAIAAATPADDGAVSPPWGENQRAGARGLLIVMVGLPARGKSFLAHKLVGYLRYRGLSARIFNAGNKRRKDVAGAQDATFFAAGNTAGQSAREKVRAREVGVRACGRARTGRFGGA